MSSLRPFLVLLLLFGGLSGDIFAQMSRRDTRRFNRAAEDYRSVRYDDAEKILRPLTKKYPGNSQVWDLLAEVQMMNYYRKTDLDRGIAFTKESFPATAGTDPKTADSLSEALAGLFNQNLPSSIYFRRSVNSWREATLHCEDAEMPSMFLRTFLLDPPPDTSKMALANSFFKKGEEAFRVKNFSDAIQNYLEALRLDSAFYRAKLFLGDAYYSKQDYREAVHYFREAVRLRPALQEPRKYLVDALYRMDDIENAGKEAIEALILYPEVGMFLKLQEVMSSRNKNLKRHWTERQVFPNTMGDQPLNEKRDRDWMEYINGFSLIEKYCNADGVIVKKNDLTKARYAEVYSWEYMLSKTSPDKFPFARQMQKAGYLDCYVMFSNYHIDFNPQYQHFARHNKERLRSYLEMLINM